MTDFIFFFKDREFQRILDNRASNAENKTNQVVSRSEIRNTNEESDDGYKMREISNLKVDYSAVIPAHKKLSMINADLHRTEQISGMYYLKENFSIHTNEMINRKYEHQKQEIQNNVKISDDIKHKIIERNNGILGLLNKKSIENHQALLNKR